MLAIWLYAIAQKTFSYNIPEQSRLKSDRNCASINSSASISVHLRLITYF
ncbi:hypothetical protein F7734_06285 [Scytonema sp. UIC 10036]|nr:hypothetical protein [Scytonema sp. UIC 10036]MUG92085.1 hypothetical protein [Scytonema sp. UIC 10036]